MGDTLLDMAINAGYFPGMENQPTLPEAGPQPVTSPAQDYGQEPQPGVAPGMFSAPNAGQITRQGGDVSFSSSESGFNGDKYNQIQRTKGGLAAEKYKADAEAEKLRRSEMASATAAHDAKVNAASEVARQTAAKIQEEGHQALLQQNMENTWKDEETKINVQAQQDAQTARNDYVVALADFRASRVDPSQLWQSMSGGQQFGTLVSVFAHDFLGARGIKTSAMDTLNTAINRNIDSQIEGIKVKGQVAEGFKDLWYMQRSQSASDAEARARVRGFMLEAAKQQTIAALAPFQAGLASAQGMAASAKLDGELAKTQMEVDHFITKNSLDAKAQAIQEWGIGVNAATASAARRESARQFDETQKRLAAPNPEDIQKDIIVDHNGMPVARFRPGIGENTKKEIYDKQAAISSMINDSEEYRRMMREYDTVKASPNALRIFQDEHSREMVALQRRLLFNERLRVTGKAANASEESNIETQVPLKTAWTNGTVERVVANFEKRGIQDMDAAIDKVSYLLPESEKASIYPSARNTFAPANKLEAANVGSGEADKTTPEQREVSTYAGLLNGPEADTVYRGTAADIKAGHRYINANIPAEARSRYATDAYASGEMGVDNITSSEVGLIRLGELAAKGNKEALGLLEHEAQGMTAINGETDWRAWLAGSILGDIRQNKPILDFDPSEQSGSAYEGPRPGRQH